MKEVKFFFIFIHLLLSKYLTYSYPHPTIPYCQLSKDLAILVTLRSDRTHYIVRSMKLNYGKNGVMELFQLV